MQLAELVVKPGAPMIGRSARDIEPAASGITSTCSPFRGTAQRTIARLRSIAVEAGDVLLVQGTPEAITGFAGDYGCLPLAERRLRLPSRGRMWLSVGILAAAIAAVTAGVPAEIAFASGVFVAMVTRVVPPRSVYTAIDWPVIVLLACLLPVAAAMETTGAADLLASFIVDTLAAGRPVIALVLVLLVTMCLSDLMNNAATVAVMAPIAYDAATSLGVQPDAFFMAVAIGGSCAFLTPVGHQNNTLILGPGGFRFGDYWRLGLPVEVIVAAVAVPLLLLVWGL